MGGPHGPPMTDGSKNPCQIGLKLWLSQAFENGSCFSKIMQNDSQNHLNNKWLQWKEKKRYLVYLRFLRVSRLPPKDCNTPSLSPPPP